MGSTFITAVTAASAVCAGVAGGVYFAFATIVVPALRALPAVEAVTAMQRLNISAVRLPFMVVFFGGAAASAAVIIAEVASGTATPAAVNRMAGAGFALASFGITIVRNVPLNNALSRLPPDRADIEAQWTAFDHAWSISNHGRGSAAIIATIILVDSLALAA